MRFWNLLLSLSLILAAGLGLMVLTGHARGLLASPLQAQLVVQDFPIPDGFGIDPDRVAAFMSKQLQDRVDQDVAMRIALKPEVLKKVKELVLPRLMNVVVVQSMMHDIPELSAILNLGAFRRSAEGTVTSEADAADVALTVPGALLAQVDGTKVGVTTTSTGMKALELGEMKAGQSHQIVVWMDESAVGIDLGRMIRLGAAGGERGRVLLWGDRGWFGEDIEALRWSRWLIGAILGGTLLFGLAGLMIPLLTARQDRARRAPAE